MLRRSPTRSSSTTTLWPCLTNWNWLFVLHRTLKHSMQQLWSFTASSQRNARRPSMTWWTSSPIAGISSSHTQRTLASACTPLDSIWQYCTNSTCLGKRLGMNVLSNNKDVINEFQDNLKQLRNAFINETTVKIGIEVLRVLGHVEAIGENLEDHSMWCIILCLVQANTPVQFLRQNSHMSKVPDSTRIKNACQERASNFWMPSSIGWTMLTTRVLMPFCFLAKPEQANLRSRMRLPIDFTVQNA